MYVLISGKTINFVAPCLNSYFAFVAVKYTIYSRPMNYTLPAVRCTYMAVVSLHKFFQTGRLSGDLVNRFSGNAGFFKNKLRNERGWR